jgi:hypothetical protein
VWFSSCKTVYPTSSNTETVWRDTTIYVNKPIYIDKIIEVPVPGYKDSLRIRDSVVVRDNYAFMKSIHVEKGIIAVDASVNRSVFSVDAYLTDSTILYHYQDTLNYQDSLTIYKAIRERTTTSTVVLPPERYIPGFYKFTFWLFMAELMVCVLLVLARLGYFGKLFNLFR